jgi:DegV family protein with EDD domain
MSVAVIVDSTCDLTPELVRQHDLEIMPINVAFGDEQFQDGINLTRANFYAKLKTAKDLPVSSPPSVEQMVTLIKKHLDAGREVVLLTISSALSETGKNAAAAAAQIGNPKVVLIDSRTLSGGLGLLAIVAGGLAQSGKSAAEIGAQIEKLRDGQRGFFTLPDLAPLARSGRIGKAQVMLGTMMKIIPILRVNPATGVVEGEAQTRTFEKAKELLVEIAMRYIPRPADTRVVIAHAHDAALGAAMERSLRAKLSAPPKYVLVTEAGPAVGVHAGEGAIAIFSAEG